jgi:hypothetical protein
MTARRAKSWVVYRRPTKGSPDGVSAVCETSEWDAMERDRPGYLTLIRAGIASEGAAERLARGASDGPVPSGPRTVPDPLSGGSPPESPTRHRRWLPHERAGLGRVSSRRSMVGGDCRPDSSPSQSAGIPGRLRLERQGRWKTGR